MTMTKPDRATREEILEALVARDGLSCQFPGCSGKLDFSVSDGSLEVTIDHWIPQWFGREEGWTYDEIWNIDNLKLMHKKCNAKKGERVPNEDGTIPDRVERTFRYRRQKRAERPEICTSCNSGRNLGPAEVCASCSSGPMPERFPQWAKVKSNECDHELFWCWACSIGIIERPAAAYTAVLSGDSGEPDSVFRI